MFAALLAEDLDHQIRKAVDNLWMLGEVGDDREHLEARMFGAEPLRRTSGCGIPIPTVRSAI